MRAQHLSWMLLCSLTILIRPASAEGLSGTYVGKAPNAAFLVQIVETAGGHLTGHYEQVLLQPGGRVDDLNAVITGAADGRTVVVTIKPSELLSSTVAASGTIEGRLLHLSGGSNGSSLSLNLLRSDEAEFQAQVASLRVQALKINDAKIEANLLANLQNLTRRMIGFTLKADASLPKFSPIEQRYHDVTRRMRAALARERSIYGGVERSQISVAISQAAIQVGQLHIEVGSSYQSFEFTSGQIDRALVDASAGCRGAHVVTGSAPIPVAYKTRNAACLRLFDAAKDYKQRVAALRLAFSNAEAIWDTERREQDQIVQASNMAAQ